MSNGSNRLLILHTNDLHSCFENMPKLSHRINEYRRQVNKEDLLIIDCGDHMDRMRMETEGSDGVANIAIMNATGYDIFVPGNNEGLTFTKEAFEHVFREHALFAVLGTNLFELDRASVPSWMSSQIVIDKNGRKIGIVGVTASYNAFYHLLGWDVRDPLETVRHVVDELRESVQLLIVVSHVGIHFDRKLAAEVTGIDCIIGGHTHHLLEQAEQASSTLIAAAGMLGKHLGVIQVEFDACSGQISSLQGRAESVVDEPDDPAITNIIASFTTSSAAIMARPVAQLAEPIHHELFRESQLGNLLADGLRTWMDADIGIVNNGQLLGGLPAGVITDGDLLRLCPSPINPCSLLVTGSQIQQALEESLVEEFVHKEIRGFGFRGKQLGTVSVSGLAIVYDPTAPDYGKLYTVLVNGEPLDQDSCYKLGTIDMFTFGIGYPSLGKGEQIRYYLPEFLRDILRQALTDPEALQASQQARIHRLRA